MGGSRISPCAGMRRVQFPLDQSVLRITLSFMDLEKPLSDGELDELNEFLDSDAVPECDMGVSMLHGYFTALAVGPVLVPEDEWTAAIWGEEGPLYDSEAEAIRIAGLVFRFFNSTNQTLAETPGEFEPVFIEVETQEGETRLSAEDWCLGFTRGMAIRTREWEPLLFDEEHINLLAPILAFTSAEAMADLLEKSGTEVTRDTLMAFIPLAVEAIYDYWKPQRQNPSAGITLGALPFRQGAKVGRNAPCPCGSGRKYKKCCAAKLN